jgi:subfamily B ATP-binding cassette protein MsbA
VLTFIDFITVSLFYPLINLVLNGGQASEQSRLVSYLYNISKIFDFKIDMIFFIKLVLVLNFLSFFSGLAYEFFIVRLRYNYFFIYMQETFQKLLKEKLDFFLKNSYGDIFNIGHSYSQSVGEIFLHIPKVVFGIFKVSLFLMYLIFINELNVISIIFIFILFGVLVYWISKRISMNHAVELESYRSNFLSIFEEAINGIRQIKIFSMEEKWLERYKLEVLAFGYQSKIIVFSSSFITYLGNFILILISLIMILSVDFENGDKSQVSKLAMSVFVILQTFPPAIQLGNHWIALKACNARLLALYNFMSQSLPLKKEIDLEILQSIDSIEFENVGFSYNGKDLVLQNISFKLFKGQRLILLGESGSGKSTLLDLIMGLHDQYIGRIMINGKDIKSFNNDSLNQKISYVSQEPLLFRGTIRENILLGNTKANQDHLMESLIVSESLSFINKYSDGIDIKLGSKGGGLSGGQKQRISIARAILKSPQILILDEATSAMDKTLSEKIETNLDSLLINSIHIVATHKENIIRKSDIVIRLNRLVKT